MNVVYQQLWTGIAIILCFSVSGCFLLPGYAGAGTLPVLRPDTFPEEVHIRQEISVERGENRYSFRAVTEITPGENRMVVVGLNSLSDRLFTVRMNSEQINVQKNHKIPMPLERIATDLQWALWDRVPDRKGFRVEEETLEDGKRKRMIYRKNQKIGEVMYSAPPTWKGELTFTSAYGYKIRVRTIMANTFDNRK